MKKKLVLLLIGFSLLYIIPFNVYAKEEILWIHADFPPFSIPIGPYINQGVCDQISQLIIDNLDEYKHTKTVSNYKRLLYEIKMQKNVGSAALLKTPERERYIEYSIPSLLLLPNGIAIHKSNLDKIKSYINNDGYFNFEKAISENRLKVGISVDRRYSGIIDETLKKYNRQGNIVIKYKSALIKNLFYLMLKGKVDFIPCYPIEAQYHATQFSSENEILFFPVDGMPEYTLNYVGFPKNEWGKNIISKVNVILGKYRQTSEFHKFYESWLDEASKKRYRKYVNEFYKLQIDAIE